MKHLIVATIASLALTFAAQAEDRSAGKYEPIPL